VALQSGVQFGTTRISGDVYTIAGDGSQPSAVVSGILGTRAFLGDPQGVAFDSRGDLVVADTGDNVIRLLIDKNVRLSGHAARADFLYTLAGNSEFGYSRDGLPGLRSIFALPTAVTVDGHGNILIADSSNNRIRVLAMSNGAFYGLSMKQGDVYTVAGSGSIGSLGSSIPTKADLTQPSGVASSSSGAAWISNSQANEVCVLEPESGTASST
jgi:sugar lactone lactonase YvrE